MERKQALQQYGLVLLGVSIDFVVVRVVAVVSIVVAVVRNVVAVVRIVVAVGSIPVVAVVVVVVVSIVVVVVRNVVAVDHSYSFVNLLLGVLVYFYPHWCSFQMPLGQTRKQSKTQ